jgi:hypothetical protein
MTRLTNGQTTPSLPPAAITPTQRRNFDHIVLIPDALLVPETDFEQLANELNPTYHDVRKRPGSVTNPC